MTNAEFGHTTEVDVYRWLKSFGIECSLQPHNSKFDLLANGKRIEVKAARPRKRYPKGPDQWCFNIHRHNVLDESNVDLYILRMEDIPHSSAAIHLVVPAPVNTKNIIITIRSMLTKWGAFYNRFDFVLHGCNGNYKIPIRNNKLPKTVEPK